MGNNPFAYKYLQLTSWGAVWECHVFCFTYTWLLLVRNYFSGPIRRFLDVRRWLIWFWLQNTLLYVCFDVFLLTFVQITLSIRITKWFSWTTESKELMEYFHYENYCFFFPLKNIPSLFLVSLYSGLKPSCRLPSGRNLEMRSNSFLQKSVFLIHSPLFPLRSALGPFPIQW